MLNGRKKNSGFTLIELLVVLAIVALLAGLAAPMTFSSMGKAKESALKQDLFVMRKAIDDYFTDNAKYPEEIGELVEAKYLRKIPKDPYTDSLATWVFTYDDSEGSQGGISDVKSGAEGKSADGEYFKDW